MIKEGEVNEWNLLLLLDMKSQDPPLFFCAVGERACRAPHVNHKTLGKHKCSKCGGYVHMFCVSVRTEDEIVCAKCGGNYDASMEPPPPPMEYSGVLEKYWSSKVPGHFLPKECQEPTDPKKRTDPQEGTDDEMSVDLLHPDSKEVSVPDNLRDIEESQVTTSSRTPRLEDVSVSVATTETDTSSKVRSRSIVQDCTPASFEDNVFMFAQTQASEESSTESTESEWTPTQRSESASASPIAGEADAPSLLWVGVHSDSVLLSSEA